MKSLQASSPPSLLGLPLPSILLFIFGEPRSVRLHASQLREDLQNRKNGAFLRDKSIGLPVSVEAGKRRQLHHCRMYPELLRFERKKFGDIGQGDVELVKYGCIQGCNLKGGGRQKLRDQF
jgi:hypothetical protein